MPGRSQPPPSPLGSQDPQMGWSSWDAVLLRGVSPVPLVPPQPGIPPLTLALQTPPSSPGGLRGVVPEPRPMSSPRPGIRAHVTRVTRVTHGACGAHVHASATEAPGAPSPRPSPCPPWAGCRAVRSARPPGMGPPSTGTDSAPQAGLRRDVTGDTRAAEPSLRPGSGTWRPGWAQEVVGWPGQGLA